MVIKELMTIKRLNIQEGWKKFGIEALFTWEGFGAKNSIRKRRVRFGFKGREVCKGVGSNVLFRRNERISVIHV